MNVAVLAGGPSSEHEVSLDTSREILTLLREGGHRVLPVLIDREDGERWSLGPDSGPAEQAFDVHGSPCGRDEALETLRSQGLVAYVGLHGPYGEDGTVQRVLEAAGVPYTGSGAAASSLGMDKELSKLAAAKAGAFTASHEVLVGTRLPTWGFSKGIGYPCFVKPVSAGSSVGVTRVEEEAGLRPAVDTAQAEDPAGRAMVEELIDGPEVTCAVLRVDGELQTFPLVAIQPSADDGFYDYHAKYVSERTGYVCPAPVPESTREAIVELSTRLYAGLDLRGVVRLDFIVRSETDTPVFLELNTLPGFTTHSLVPMAARTGGWTPLAVLEAVLRDTTHPAHGTA